MGRCEPLCKKAWDLGSSSYGPQFPGLRYGSNTNSTALMAPCGLKMMFHVKKQHIPGHLALHWWWLRGSSVTGPSLPCSITSRSSRYPQPQARLPFTQRSYHCSSICCLHPSLSFFFPQFGKKILISSKEEWVGLESELWSQTSSKFKSPLSLYLPLGKLLTLL